MIKLLLHYFVVVFTVVRSCPAGIPSNPGSAYQGLERNLDLPGSDPDSPGALKPRFPDHPTTFEPGFSIPGFSSGPGGSGLIPTGIPTNGVGLNSHGTILFPLSTKKTTVYVPLENYNDRNTNDRLRAISIVTGEHSLGKDNQANVTIEICPHGYKCCQTNSLDQDGQDFTRLDLERKFTSKQTLGSCHKKKFPIENFKDAKRVKDDGIPNTVLKSVKVTFTPNYNSKVTWNPKDVIVCFSNTTDLKRPIYPGIGIGINIHHILNVRYGKYHSLWCKDLEHQGLYGPETTTKELIEHCVWYKDFKCDHNAKRRHRKAIKKHN